MYRHSHLKDAPVVIVDRSPSRARPVVVDCFRSASGVKPGMTLEQAVSRHANAVVLDADEPHYRRVFGQVLSSLQGISDRVEEADLGTAYVRLDGLGRTVSRRGLSRLRSAERSPSLPDSPGRRSGRQVPRVRRGRNVRGTRSVQGPGRRGIVPRTPYHRPAACLRRHEEGVAPLRPAHVGGHCFHERAHARGPFRAGREVGLVAVQRHRPQPRFPVGVRGVGGRTHLAAVPLLFHRCTLRRCGYSPQEGLRPMGHKGQACRRGTPPLRGLRLA